MMKTVIAIGCEGAQHEQVFELLKAAGVQAAVPGRREGLTPQALQALMLKANDIDLAKSRLGQAKLGKLWNELATDLFVANLSQPQWGWSDPQSVVFMDFWRVFDNQVRLLLIYNSPQDFLAQRLTDASVTHNQIEELLSEWRLWNGRLLSYRERYPDQTLLVSSERALDEPEEFLELLQSQWGLNLGLQDKRVRRDAGSPDWYPMQAKLATELIPAGSPAWDIHTKLQSVASLPGSSNAIANPTEAWTLWNDICKRIHTAEVQLSNELTRLQEQLEQERRDWTKDKGALVQKTHGLSTEKDQLQQKLTALTTEHSKTKQTFEAQVKQYNHREAELKTAMQTVKDNIHKELSAAVAKQEQLRKELEQAKKQAADSEARCKSMQSSGSAVETLTHRLKDTQEENDLLLKQLHEVQDELEQLFLRQQAAKPVLTSPGSELSQKFWHRHQPTEVVIDLRSELVGAHGNWYEAESDGRWAGPQSPSRLEFPSFQPGTYEVELLLVDAMSPDVLQGLSIEAEGQSVPLSIERPLTGHPFPVKAKGRLKLGNTQAKGGWQLALNFAHAVSPSESGDPDTRRLSVRVQSVVLHRLTTEA